MPKKKTVETASEEVKEARSDMAKVMEDASPPESLEQMREESLEEPIDQEAPRVLSVELMPDEQKDVTGPVDDPLVPMESAQGGLISAVPAAEAIPVETPTPTGEGEPVSESSPKSRRRAKPTEDPPHAAEDSQPEDVPVEADEKPMPPERPMSVAAKQRQEFYATDFWGVDRNLSPEQRQEWSAIYASYRGQSVIRGKVVGVDPMRMWARDRKTGENIELETYCATISSCCARIIIPREEMWFSGEERPDFVLRNLHGAIVDFVVTQVDREGSFVVASRRKAMASRRRYFAQSSLNQEGARAECDLLVVGPRRCLVSCYGHDVELTQREMSYTAIADLREAYKDKSVALPCIVKGFHSETGQLMISIKETKPNPFDGADLRHPEGSRRQGEIAGKYGGGVFVILPDGVTVMCNYAFQYEDSDFESGDQVLVVISRYVHEKKEVYGKIVAKC